MIVLFLLAVGTSTSFRDEQENVKSELAIGHERPQSWDAARQSLREIFNSESNESIEAQYKRALEYLYWIEPFIEDWGVNRSIIYWFYRAGIERGMSLNAESSLDSAVRVAMKVDFGQGTFETLTSESLSQIDEAFVDLGGSALLKVSNFKNFPYPLERILLVVLYINGSTEEIPDRLKQRKERNLGVTSSMLEIGAKAEEANKKLESNIKDVMHSMRVKFDPKLEANPVEWPYYFYSVLRDTHDNLTWRSLFDGSAQGKNRAHQVVVRILGYEVVLGIDPAESPFNSSAVRDSLLEAIESGPVYVERLYYEHCPSNKLMETFYCPLETEELSEWTPDVLYNEAQLFFDAGIYKTCSRICEIGLAKAETADQRARFEALIFESTVASERNQGVGASGAESVERESSEGGGELGAFLDHVPIDRKEVSPQ